MTDRAAECLAKLGLEHPADSEQSHAPAQVKFQFPNFFLKYGYLEIVHPCVFKLVIY